MKWIKDYREWRLNESDGVDWDDLDLPDFDDMNLEDGDIELLRATGAGGFIDWPDLSQLADIPGWSISDNVQDFFKSTLNVEGDPRLVYTDFFEINMNDWPEFIKWFRDIADLGEFNPVPWTNKDYNPGGMTQTHVDYAQEVMNNNGKDDSPIVTYEQGEDWIEFHGDTLVSLKWWLLLYFSTSKEITNAVFRSEREEGSWQHIGYMIKDEDQLKKDVNQWMFKKGIDMSDIKRLVEVHWRTLNVWDNEARAWLDS